MPAETVERRIIFHRAVATPRFDGSIPRLNFAEAFEAIQNLRFLKKSVGPESRYADVDGKILSARPHNNTHGLTIEIGRVRRVDLPLVDQGEEIGALDIKDDDGLIEQCHMKLFPNHVIGVEFNFYGPRASSLPNYIANKVPSFPEFQLRPLLNKDIAQQIGDMEDIRLADIRVHASQVENLAAIDESVPAALRATTKSFNANSVEIVLRAPRGKSLKSTMYDVVASLVGLSVAPVERFETLKIRGKSIKEDRVMTYDLLKDQFIQTKHIAKMIGKSRAINSASMCTAIDESYNQLKGKLNAAASAEIE